MLLLFPQWQGTGFAAPIPEGTRALSALIGADMKRRRIDCAPFHELDTEGGIHGRAELLANVNAATSILAEERPEKLLTLGGDCSIDIAPIAHMNARLGGNLRVFWFDAHADLNTPESSESGNFHGMPLRVLSGEGPEDFTRAVPLTLTPRQIAFVGLRSVDPPEQDYIRERNILCTGSSLQGLDHGDFRHAHIHVDCDVLDRGVFDACSCPTSGGLSLEALLGGLETVFASYTVLSATLTEYAPQHEGHGFETIRRVLEEGFRASAHWG